MAEKEKDKEPQEDKSPKQDKRISERDRYRFIGFEVFPGQPKDLFKSDAEKEKYVEGVRSKRSREEIIREQCTLLEERVSKSEKILLTIASVVVLGAFLLPWYSAYTEVSEKPTPEVDVTVVPDSLALDAQEDSALGLPVDSVSLAALADTASAEQPAVPETTPADRGVVSHQGSSSQEEIITGHVAKAKKTRVYSRLSGFGALLSIGSVGSYMFSSGLVLVLTAILLILFALACVLVPAYNLYSIYGIKGSPDETALRLKKNLRLNWLPLILFLLVFFLSFVGSNYGFDAASTYTSLGGSYGPGVLLGSLSWGIFVAIAASIMSAVKGIEI